MPQFIDNVPLKDVDSAQTACYDPVNQLVYFQAEALPGSDDDSSDDADTVTTLLQFDLVYLSAPPVPLLQPFAPGLLGFCFVRTLAKLCLCCVALPQ